jgi:glycine oxidase
MTGQAPDVVIIGGGVIGSAIALRLAQENLRVTVLDQNEPGREASGVAVGILSPQAESNGPTPFFRLADASRAIYPTFAEELRETTGMDVELRLDGVVAVAENETEDEKLAARFRWQSEAGLAVERLNAKELMELEPSLRSGLRGGIFFPNDGQVVGPRVTEAVIRAAANAGVRFESGNPAQRVRHENGKVTGVEAANGVVACAQVVNAAGAWSGFDSTLPFAVPIRPARGDIVALRGEPVPRHVVYSHELYVVPRLDGRILLGATMEFAGFDSAVKAAGVHKLMTGCFELLPDLEGAEFDTAWAGLRPCAPDQLPILGITPIEGLHVATGHCRNGILLAPITARVAADIITKGTSDFDLSPFSVCRFENT